MTKDIIQAISDPPKIRSLILDRINRVIKAFDEYEKRETEDFYRCNHCNPIANLFLESEIFWDDEHGWLCERCFGEAEADRETEAEEKKIVEDEKKFHHRGF